MMHTSVRAVKISLKAGPRCSQRCVPAVQDPARAVVIVCPLHALQKSLGARQTGASRQRELL
jgi:hypothetical protein